MPSAIGIGANEFLVTEYFHGLGFGKRGAAAFFLEVDVVVTLGTFKDDSVGSTHNR